VGKDTSSIGDEGAGDGEQDRPSGRGHRAHEDLARTELREV
jgi:hypothetical protein